jgi:hypothetical protein
VRPAIDVGISVSRVGGKAQIPAMKQIAGSLRLDLAAFRELEAFAQLGTELDKASQSQLDRGYRMVEVLKQPQFKPMNVIDQTLIIFAGSKGGLDKIPIRQVAAWEQQFLQYMGEQKTDLRNELAKERSLAPRKETPAARKAFNDALALLQGGKFEEAEKAFKGCADIGAYKADVATALEQCKKRNAQPALTPKPPTLEEKLQQAIGGFQPQFRAPS